MTNSLSSLSLSFFNVGISVEELLSYSVAVACRELNEMAEDGVGLDVFACGVGPHRTT